MISEVSYSIINQGFLKGTQAFFIHITNGIGGEEDEAVDTILKIRSFSAKGCKLVMFEGKFTVENSENLFSMCKSLGDMGYKLGCHSNGKFYFPWMSFMTFNSVTPVGTWLNFKVNEFIFDYVIGNKPQLPPEVESVALYINGKDEDVVGFIRNSSLWWRVLYADTTIRIEL